MGLPLHVDRLTIFPNGNEAADRPLFAVVTRQPEQSSFDAEVVDAKGNCHLRVSGYHTVSLPDAIDPQKLKSLQTSMSLVSTVA
jgi:hypothetical protein